MPAEAPLAGRAWRNRSRLSRCRTGSRRSSLRHRIRASRNTSSRQNRGTGTAAEIAGRNRRTATAAGGDRSAERRQPLRFVWQMDADGRFTLELRRIQGADRSANRRRARPAVERDRRPRSGSIPKARSRARSPRAKPGAASPSPSRSTAPTRALRSSCPGFRCSIATAISAAIAASASAATSRASPN